MSYILEALKRAGQGSRKGRVSPGRLQESSPSGTVGEEPAWDVKMVSPFRFVRINLKERRSDDRSAGGRELWEGIAREAGYDTAPDRPVSTEERRRRRLPKGYGVVAAAALALLLLLTCVLAYDARTRMAAVATEVTNLTRQADGAQARLAKLEEDVLRLNLQNSAVRQEQEAVRTELQTLEHRQPHAAARKRHPATADQREPRVPPPAIPPPWLIGPEAQRSPDLEVVQTPSVTVYSIR
jgi:hypothetical protein